LKNPKAKGNEFELKVAKILSEWSGQQFHRTPASGALHWSNDKRVISDIVPPETLKDWPFSIECKKVEGANWEFSALIEGTSQTLKEHWKQACEDADREDMIPLLVFSKNFHDIYVMMKWCTFVKLGIHPESFMTLMSSSGELALMKFSDLLSQITIENLLKTFK
jgi:hypothetical protein